MFIAAFVLGAVAAGLATQTSLPDESPSGRLSARLGRELGGVTVFGVGTLSLALGIADVARKTPNYLPALVLLLGWLALRLGTRKDQPRARVVLGVVAAILALILGELLVAWAPF